MIQDLPFDPIQRSNEVEALVMDGNRRRYYRFRHARFYMGIVTADAVGCNLLCAYCWNYAKNEKPTTGTYYSPQEVAGKLISIAKKKQCWKFRISGCEPFLGQASTAHLYEIINRVLQENPASRFIIETNGVMLGACPGLLDDFPIRAGDQSTKLRISLKGMDNQQAESITGAIGVYDMQIKAIQEIAKRGLYCGYATMPQFIPPNHKFDMPKGIGREQEMMKPFAGTAGRLKLRGLI